MDKETLKILGKRQFPGSTLTVKFTESVEDSRGINMIMSGAIIISASGICDAGRILHHLKHNFWRSECSVIFVG